MKPLVLLALLAPLVGAEEPDAEFAGRLAPLVGTQPAQWRVVWTSDPATAAHLELMASPGQRASILDPRFEQAGVGVARLGESYWVTQIFVAP